MKDLKNKIVNFISVSKKKIAGALASVSVLALGSVPVFAETTGASVTNVETEMQTFMSTLTELVSFSDVISIVGIGLSACFGIYLAWWGARKLFSMLKKAISRGKIGF